MESKITIISTDNGSHLVQVFVMFVKETCFRCLFKGDDEEVVQIDKFFVISQNSPSRNICYQNVWDVLLILSP